MASKSSNNQNQQEQEQELLLVSSAYTTALLRSLHFSGVKFLRFFTVDVCNNVRCKVKPVDHLLLKKNNHNNNNNNVAVASSLDYQVSVAEVCYAGLPYYSDHIIDGTGMNAKNVLVIQPDLTSFRILPYAPKSAIVMGNLYDQYTNKPSPFCTRSLLGKVVYDAAEEHSITFSVGIELEFCLVDSKTEQFVDKSVFANTITLNEQEEFLNDLYNQLQEQYITIELIHAESGPGQIEIVLEYIKNDPVQVVDNVLLAKETIHAVAHKYGLKALFIPKYDFLKAGNGLHVHMSIYDSITGEQIFCNNSSLTQKGSAFVEGILIHMKGLLGLTMPTVNSFRRVGPGCWTGSQIGWDLEDKECGVRVCSNIKTKEWDNVEYKFCDGSCNLYLGLAALLSSGLDGMSKSLKLRPSLRELEKVVVKNKSGGGEGGEETDQPSSPTITDPIPASLIEALGALEEDNHIIDLIGPRLSKAYLALRYDEAHRSSGMSLEDEVKEALARS